VFGPLFYASLGLLTYCQVSVEHTHAAGVMDARWLLSRASESGAAAMGVKWLLGRADESVVAIGCCVTWVGLIMQISRVVPYSAGATVFGPLFFLYSISLQSLRSNM